MAETARKGDSKFIVQKLRYSLFASLILSSALSFAWAGSDMSSASHKIRRSDINSGGSDKPSSANFKMTDSAGTRGGSLLSGSTFFVFSGFSNLVSHPDSVEDLSAITGVAPDQIVLSWTAPTAYGSSGTASSYAVRYSSVAPISTELGFVGANAYVNNWIPKMPGALEAQTASGLFANTTYYFVVKGQDTAGNAGYVSNPGAASTLTNPVSGVQITNVYSSSITLTWTGLGSGNAEGYVVQASTLPSFGGVIRSSSTSDVAVTTLTVVGLRRGKLTYLRVGAVNWSGTANFVNAGSTITLPGPAPVPLILAVYTSSITLQWAPVGSDDGYSAEASSSAGFTPISQSSVTSSGNDTTLTITNLYANARYFLRVGSLYDDATNYGFTIPVSTVTPAAVPVNGSFSNVFASSFSLNWGSSINAAGTIFQAEISTLSAVGAVQAVITTSGLTNNFTALVQDTTYWARVKALGITGEDSAYLFVGSTITLLLPPSGVSFTDVGLSSATLNWTFVGPNITYSVDMAETNPFAPHQSSATAGSAATLFGLTPDILYFARVKARSLSSGNVSPFSLTASSSTLAKPPILLTATSETESSVSLAWNGNGNPSSALYDVERSTDGYTFKQVGAVRAVAYQDQGLWAGTAYSYRVRAINENGTPSAYSLVILVKTNGVPSTPRAPTGLRGQRTVTGSQTSQVVYQWRRVTKHTDGTPLTNLDHYQIYRSDNLFSPKAKWTLAATVSGETWTTAATSDKVYYYCIVAVDAPGLSSDWSHIMNDMGDIEHFWIGPDNVSRAELPQAAANILLQEHNRYSADLELQLLQQETEETGRVVRSIQMNLINFDTGNVIPDIVFDPPIFHGTLGFAVQNGKVMQGAPGREVARTALIDASQAVQQLSLFWFNGNDWVKTTGLVSNADHTVSFTGARPGRYQIRLARQSGLTLTRVYPRIITPNGDGWNDKAVFQFDNPNLNPLSGKIFDISGSAVADLKPGPNPDSTLVWDGKSSNGQVVPAGIYLYQVTVDGTTLTGTLVVAR